jgi:hypothetical protein
MAHAFGGRRRAPRWSLLGGGLALAVTLVAVPAHADPVAVIAAVKGRVDVTSSRGGPARRAGFGHALERGDRVTVAGGGAATLFFNDGNVVELAERSSLRVGGQLGARAGRAAGLPGDVYASVSKFVAGGSRETGRVALSTLRSAPAEAGAPVVIAPRRTAVMTDRPGFAWRAVPGATRYRVTVSSAEGGELWRREAAGLSLPFPADAAPLARAAEYLWEIEALSDERSLRRESSVFEVTSEARAREVSANLARIRESAGGPDSPAGLYLAGSYLSGLGLFVDAAERFVAMSALMPSSPASHEALGAVYTTIGLTDLAAAEYQQALALTREP